MDAQNCLNMFHSMNVNILPMIDTIDRWHVMDYTCTLRSAVAQWLEHITLRRGEVYNCVEPWASSFHLRCCSSSSCMHKFLVVDSGG